MDSKKSDAQKDTHRDRHLKGAPHNDQYRKLCFENIPHSQILSETMP